MSYETGTSTGPDDLLDKLRLFLIGDGWSVNKWETDNSEYGGHAGLIGTGKRLHVQITPSSGGPELYFNFRSVNRGIIFDSSYSSASPTIGGKYYGEVTGLGMYGSTGYDGGETWDDQPGHPATTTAKCWGTVMTELSTTSIPAYYFFSDEDTVVVCIEYESGKFQWFTFGLLEREGMYNGGQFFFGSLCSYRPSYQYLFGGDDQTGFLCKMTALSLHGNGGVYLNVDSLAGWRASGDVSSDYDDYLEMPGCIPNEASPTYSYFNTLCTFWMTRSPNFYNSIAPLVPATILCKRASNNYCILGHPASVRLINPQYYDPGEELVLGSDTWMIFPSHSKDDNDARMGVAVRKIT